MPPTHEDPLVTMTRIMHTVGARFEDWSLRTDRWLCTLCVILGIHTLLLLGIVVSLGERYP